MCPYLLQQLDTYYYISLQLVSLAKNVVFSSVPSPFRRL